MGGWWWLVVGGGWWLVVGGGWWLVVGGGWWVVVKWWWGWWCLGWAVSTKRSAHRDEVWCRHCVANAKRAI